MTDDIPKFASTVKSIAEYGYDHQRVLEEFNDIQYHQDKLRAMKIAVDEKQKEIERLDGQNSSLLKSISLHSSKADLYNQLDIEGFGIKELKRLLDTIMNIATSNQISYWVAIDKFFSDIETQYDAKLGFESAKDKLITEINMLKEEREKMLENLRNQPLVGPIIMRFHALGLNENDIVEYTKIFPKIWKSSYSIIEIALGVIRAVEEMASNRTRTASNDKTIEILGRTKEELSKLDLS